MTTQPYPGERTGLLLVDPYNDFLSDGGKLNGLARPVADAVGTVRHLREIVAAAHEINGPTYAHAILTTSELLARISGTEAR